jgi:hypothetical protein
MQSEKNCPLPPFGAITYVHERHELTEGKRRLVQPSASAGREEVPVIDGRKPLAEIIDIAEHRNELQLVHRNPLVWRLIRGGTNRMRGFHCCVKALAYPELTLDYASNFAGAALHAPF